LLLVTTAFTFPGVLGAAHDASVPQAATCSPQQGQGGGAPPQAGGAPPQAPGSPVRDREPGPPAHGQATLMLAPSRLEVATGATIRMSLAVLGARNMTRLPVTVRYDSELLDLISVRLGDAWNDGPKPVFLHDTARPGEIVVGIARFGDVPGLVGIGAVLELEFRARQPGEARLWLDRFAVIAADSTSQPTRAVPATITVR